jgi:TolB protein
MRCSLGVLILSILAAFPANAAATWPGKPGRIAYSAFRGGDESLYSIRADGRRNRRIVSSATGNFAWSRDGRRIAFLRPNGDLWKARSDGSRARRIVALPARSTSDPAWSPSGNRLTLARLTGGEIEVWIVRRDGTGLRRLVRGQSATWSSRGVIAYATGNGDIATIRPDGRGGRRIWVPQGSPVVSELDFSPNGRRLVFQQGRPSGARSTIRTIDLRTRRSTRITDQTRQVNALDVAWAPGGRRLVYVHGRRQGDVRDPAEQVRTIRPSGKGRRTLFTLPQRLLAFSLAWQTR